MEEDKRPIYYSGYLPDDPEERKRILHMARDDADVQYHLEGLKRTAPIMFYVMVLSPFLAAFFGWSFFSQVGW